VFVPHYLYLFYLKIIIKHYLIVERGKRDEERNMKEKGLVKGAKTNIHK
jgi:hypothetical protein